MSTRLLRKLLSSTAPLPPTSPGGNQEGRAYRDTCRQSSRWRVDIPCRTCYSARTLCNRLAADNNLCLVISAFKGSDFSAYFLLQNNTCSCASSSRNRAFISDSDGLQRGFHAALLNRHRISFKLFLIPWGRNRRIRTNQVFPFQCCRIKKSCGVWFPRFDALGRGRMETSEC